MRRERLIKSLPHSCHRVYLRNLRKAVWLHWDGAKPMCLAPLVLYFEYSIRMTGKAEASAAEPEQEQAAIRMGVARAQY